MGKAWRSARAMKQLATVLLLLALVGISVSTVASRKGIAIQGPGALQAIDEGTVWVGVNEELWILDRDGHRVGQRSARELGLTGSVSSIILAPDNQAILTSREDLDWQVVDRGSLQRVRTITPQWPAGFADNYLRAIHLAVAPDGDIAVGTGGGHAVLLFDRDGRLKARSAPGTFHFTNGIWWSPEGWWTTDTNRFALHLLDAQSLAVLKSVRLAPRPGPYLYLGELQRSQGKVHPQTQQAPLATVTRLGYLMEPGHAVDVFPDGSQLAFNLAPYRQLRDITWFDGHLLLVDGGTYTIPRFAADRTTAPLFGDAQVQRAWGEMREQREFWLALGSRHAVIVSVLLLLAGIAAYAWHKRLAAGESGLPESATILVSVPRRWREVLAAFVLPGSGQWMQGRFPIGVVFFTAAALLCILEWGPVLWALHGPKMDVSSLKQSTAALHWLLLSLLSAVEAFRFSSVRRKPR